MSAREVCSTAGIALFSPERLIRRASLANSRFSPILRLASGAPFNISIGGNDRNLDDVGNDRPNFTWRSDLLSWRERGEPIDPAILSLFSLPTIGAAWEICLATPVRVRDSFSSTSTSRASFASVRKCGCGPRVEFDNVLNKTVFSFGSEFIDFNAFRSDRHAGSTPNFSRFLPRRHSHASPAPGSPRRSLRFLKLYRGSSPTVRVGRSCLAARAEAYVLADVSSARLP